MTSICSVVRGVGGYLPQRVMTNAEIKTLVETSDEWIRQRTGIGQRHMAAAEETTSDLATAAARQALEHAGMDVGEVDMIIVATTTPDYTFPAVATLVQENLGMHHGFAFDQQAVCSGFVFALASADSYLKSGMANSALVIGADTMTRILDWKDRNTCVLFGDGAGAVVLQARQCDASPCKTGILSTRLRSDGRHWQKLYVDGGVSGTGTVGHIRMQGREVFKHAVAMITDVINDALKDSGFEADDLDWFIPHQANRRIIDGAGRKVGIAPEKVVVTVERHANTSAASVPLALNEAVRDGRIKPGDLVMLEAMGGGFTWGASLIRWIAD